MPFPKPWGDVVRGWKGDERKSWGKRREEERAWGERGE